MTDFRTPSLARMRVSRPTAASGTWPTRSCVVDRIGVGRQAAHAGISPTPVGARHRGGSRAIDCFRRVSRFRPLQLLGNLLKRFGAETSTSTVVGGFNPAGLSAPWIAASCTESGLWVSCAYLGRMLLRFPALVGVLLVGAACSAVHHGSAAQPGFTPGTSVHRISVDGLDRSYRVYIPAGLPDAAPLVIMLHGGYGSAEQAERSYGWNQLADSAKFVVGYPDGIRRAWNAGGGCCGWPAREGIDDVGFITAVVGDIADNVGIDPARVYATGISNGGMLAYKLACETRTFAAIGAVAATHLDPCSAPHPTSVMHIHGTADRAVRYNGGLGEGPGRIDGPPVPDVNAFWRNVDGCPAPTVTTEGTVTTSTADCVDGRGVVLITIEGAGHQWPGGTPFRPGADLPSEALNATSTLWQFFAGHPQCAEGDVSSI